MPVNRLKTFLDDNNVKYVVISHSRAYTAQEVAESAHIPGKEMAKTVVVKLDGNLAMLALPASKVVDFDKLKEVTGVNEASLASEDEFKDKFGRSETGAMPPFGNLYDMDTYVDNSLAEDEEIAFNAGSHTEVVRLAYADFEKHVKPKVVDITPN